MTLATETGRLDLVVARARRVEDRERAVRQLAVLEGFAAELAAVQA